MLSLLAAAIALQSPIDPAGNGVWVDGNGNSFVLVSPYSLWGNFDGRHYTACSINGTSAGTFSGHFEDSSDMILAWYAPATEQEKSQISLVADFPYDGGQLPSEQIPLVPKPQAPADSGEVAITQGANRKTLKLVFTTAGKQVVYSDSIYFVGKAPMIQFGGTYSTGGVNMALSSTGDRSRKTLDGIATIDGKAYTLRGGTVWSRGEFKLVNRDSGTQAGEGWIEWVPSQRFALNMRKGIPAPTDQIEAWFTLTSGAYPKGLHVTLKHG